MKLLISIPDELKTEVRNHGLSLCPNDKTALVNAINHGIPHETVTEFADRCRECGRERVLDKIRTEINQYGSIWVQYTIKGHTDKDIEGIIEDVLKQAKEQVLDVIDKYRKEVSS